jgi:hypothetical protein
MSQAGIPLLQGAHRRRLLGLEGGLRFLKANSKDVCVAQAKGAEKMALADLTADYQPSTKSRYDARVAHEPMPRTRSRRRKCDDQSATRRTSA